MRFETPELERRYSLLVEGQCPRDHGPLERRDHYGYCATCALGWSIRGDTVYVRCVDDDDDDFDIGTRGAGTQGGEE